MKTIIYKDYAAFCEREDKSLNGVSQEFADSNPGWENNRENEGGWNCSRCSDCYDCSRCSDCYDCSRCYDKKEIKTEESFPMIPIVPNIHQSVLAAVGKKDALEMGTWHTCGMTHCRGGWVIALAGEAGRNLEEATSSEFAAMQIYDKSSAIKVSPVRFYETNEQAMADIRRCAKEEAK